MPYIQKGFHFEQSENGEFENLESDSVEDNECTSFYKKILCLRQSSILFSWVNNDMAMQNK